MTTCDKWDFSGSSEGPFRYHSNVADSSPLNHDRVNLRPDILPVAPASEMLGAAIGMDWVLMDLWPFSLRSFTTSADASDTTMFST